MERLANYIGGEFLPPSSGKYLPNHDPAVGQVYAELPDSDAADVERAVTAATKAFSAWSTLPAEERCKILFQIADRIEEQLEPLARAESVDSGKPISEARKIDLPRAPRNLRFFATAAVHFSSESHSNDEAVNYTLRRPVGVAGCISPWNLPLLLFTWKVAPALAAGNCVVAKPSELTPMTAYLFSRICMESGLPPGVLNVVHGLGTGAGRAIVAHPKIPLISFTGGTRTGEEIAKSASPMFKRLSLELGGKNPNLVFADCRIDEMLSTSLRSAFQNQGEICLSGSRILIERSLYPRFREEFVSRTKALRVGDPLDENTDVGALISAAHQEKVLSYIALAKKEGGKVLCGGEAVVPEGRCKKGWFVAPTVIENLAASARCNQEEIFGPVVTLTPFDREEEAIEMANGTPYGLAATLWTENVSRAHRVAAALQCGVVWVNCWMHRDLRTPFGGAKQSGIGREGGWEAMRFFTETKNICVRVPR